MNEWMDWEHRWPDKPGFWWFYGGIKVYLQLWEEIRIEQQAGKDLPTAYYRPVQYPDPPQKVARSTPDLNRPQEYKGPPRMDLK